MVRVQTRAQAIWTAVLITLGTVVMSVILAALAIPVTGFYPGWQHWLFATVIPLILAPFFVIPLVGANFRLVQIHRELERMALTDSLTGLPNRRAFFRKANRAFAAAGERKRPVAVMMIDVDRFKAINDAYGHDVGDDVLERVASSIRAAAADCSASIDSFAARIGGEEFVVVAAGIDETTVLDVARGIGDRVRKIGYMHAGAAVTTTVSIGIALRKQDEGIDDVLRAADAAVYVAKREGRDRWVLAPADGKASIMRAVDPERRRRQQRGRHVAA